MKVKSRTCEELVIELDITSNTHREKVQAFLEETMSFQVSVKEETTLQVVCEVRSRRHKKAALNLLKAIDMLL